MFLATLRIFWFILLTSHLGAKSQAINPLKDPNICGLSSCEIDNEKFSYSQNVIYKYSYDSSFQTLFDGTDNNDLTSELFISASVEVTFPTKCQGQLKLRSVRLKNLNLTAIDDFDRPAPADYEYEEDAKEKEEVTNSTPDAENIVHSRSPYFSKEIEDMDLRFDFHDGLIQEICPNSDEPVWVTNFKRGILSAFQNTMTRFDLDHKSTETDVSGKCEVFYRFTGSRNTSILITKRKDISSCQNRNKFKSIIQTTPYEFRRSDISWWPIYNSSSFCKFSIDNFIFNDIECHEHHILIPFSNGESGAVSKSIMKLRLVSETPLDNANAGSVSIEARKSLLYDHSFSPKPTHNEIKVSRDYLKQMCSLGFPNIQRDFPDRFVKFLAASKQLSIRGLQQLSARASGICTNGRKHVMESLPFIGSVASVELMKDLIIGKIKSSEVTQEMEEVWLNSMFYLPRPEESTIETMFSLIQHYEENQKPIFVLIPSSVVHTFCKFNECRNLAIVMNVVKYLEGMAVKALAGDFNDRTNYQNLLVSFKGLGNIGIISPEFARILKDLIIDEDRNDEVKLQAIQAFRKTNCDKTKDFFMDIYQNFTQSVEIRIGSYLQFMKCPSYLTIKTVRTFLPSEQVNQVGSFVWSHLTNLAKTSSPQKVELQGLLADNKLDDKFKMDFRKFSKNYEYSLFFDEYNFGLSGESNVIFGTESYLPRSIFFNGTINLFGNSVNPFEFNIRMQGMEKYVESIFGLEGPLNFDRMIDKFGFVFEKFKSIFNFDEDIIETILRSRRSTQNSKQLIENFAYAQKYNFNKPTGYFEHRVFGNDINFYHFEGFDQLSDIIKKLVPMEQMKNIFSKKEETFIKSGTFIDVAYTVPLSSGFPLVLSGFGAYSLDMGYYGAVNNKNIWETNSLDFNGRLKPSLSMELSTKMQIDVFYASTDVKVKSNVYSNYAIEADVKIDGNKYASIKVKLPQDRNDIFSIRSQLIGNNNQQGQDQLLYGITDRYMNSTCSWPTIDNMLGLKVCIDYSLPDVSDTSKTYPSLVLSGPIVFDIHLDKADLSAKIFNFEYQWNKGKEFSHGFITFETPGTKIPRQFSATLRTDPQNYNLTMGFENGENTQTALGFIKNAPDEKSVDFSININGKKHFSMELSMIRKILSKSKSSITPKFMLIINDQKVAGMVGSVRTISKNNVTQHDFDIKFETKKMKSTSIGHLIKTETSLATKMQYIYKFSGKKEETIDIDAELANRSQRLRERTEYSGRFKFVSSAYSHYNFASGVTFISSLGHMETKFEVNNAPDLTDPSYTMTTKVTLAKNTEDNKNSRTMFSIEITRPKSTTDLKFHIKYDEHYKNGTEHNVLMLIRYSPKKEMIATGSVLLLRGPLFGIDARFTLSIPDMNSCSAAIKIKERVKKDYYIDINGEWFTGENIKFVGLYQDRTSNVKRYYKLKSVISSKMFDDINCSLKYSRDFQELKFKVHTEYKSKSYSLLVESSEIVPLQSIFMAELNWAEHSYSISANSSMKGSGRTKVEIHLDRIRDMNLEVWGIAKRFSKNFGVEFKWDANRDPSQKFVLSYDFDKPRPSFYTGNVLISYPDRTLNGNVELSNEGPYSGSLKLSWSADEVIDMRYSVGSDLKDYKKLWAVMKIDTPFSGWRSNRMNGSLYQKDNLLAINFATIWAEHQTIAFEFFIDYLLGDGELSGELKAGIQSTIKDIPIVTAYLKHNQTSDKVDSELLFRHKNFVSEDFRNFSMKSSWKHSIDSKHRNVSGSIKFRSPFENYNSGALITKFSLTKDRELYGVIDVDIDSRLYSFAIEGYMKRLLDNMISFNLTTPIETFPYLLGKFGIVELKRYLIADLKTSNRSLGIEVLFDFQSITDFDLKFYVATPQPAFEKVLAIGKIKEHMVHLEGAWNKISLGFKGIWHFVKYNDFEYSYLIFTPLKHFGENGLIVKFMAKDIQNFDVESSFKLGKYKLGLKAFGEPRTQLINQLGMQKASYIREDFYINDDLDSDEATEDTKIDIDLAKYYSIVGNFELCTILWSPVNGNYEVQQVDDTFHGNAKIFIPKGMVEVKNKFVIRSNYNYVNRLTITTPMPDLKSISSNFKLNIPEERGFTARFDVGASNGSAWSNYGFKMSYTLPSTADVRVHDMTLIVLYPWKNTSRININTRIELAKNSVQLASITLNGFNTIFKMSGTMNQHEKDLDLAFNVLLQSPILELYTFDSYLKKASVENRNKLLTGFSYNDNSEESKFDSVVGWREDKRHIIDGDFAISSNIFPFQKFNTSVFITEGQDPEFSVKILYGKTADELEEFKFNILKKELNFEGELTTPFKDYSNVRFNGFLVELDQPNTYKAKGNVFKGMLPHSFEGDVTLFKNLPIQADFTIKDSKGKTAMLNYNLVFEDMKRLIKTHVKKDDDFISFESELYIKHLMDWAYNIRIQSSKEEFNELKLSTMLTPLSKTQFESSFEMSTPWSSHYIDNVNVSSLLKLNGNDGDFKLLYEISKLAGSGGCSWKWLQKPLKQEYQLNVFTEKKDKSKRFSTEIAYSNSSKTPTDFSFAVDINSVWNLISKSMFDIRNTKDMSLSYDLKLPEPIKSNHRLIASYKGHEFPPMIKDDSFADFHASYENEEVLADVAAKGSIKTFSDMTNKLSFEWGKKSQTSKLDSDFKLQKVDEKTDCSWELSTPYYAKEKTFNLKSNYYTQDDIFRIVHMTIFSPESRQITVGDVAFADLTNMKGSVNCSLPIFNLTWFNVNFDFDTQNEESGKFIKATWPENYALLDSKSTFVNQKNHKEWKGTIKTELPLHTKHNIQIIYGLEEKPLITTGDASVEYNSKNIVNSHYTCKTEKISEIESKDVINLSLENEMRPLGIHYIHQKKIDRKTKTDFNMKHLEIFDLSKDNRFNITGEFTVEIDDNNQKYKLVAIHPNRTIEWTSDYSSKDTKAQQSSRIELAKNIWLAYDVEIFNHTKEDAESQELKLKISYPTRNVSVGGLYHLKDDAFDTDLTVQWSTKESETEKDEDENEEATSEAKTIQGKFQWRDLEVAEKSKDHQSLMIAVKHPSFEKDVTLQGSYLRDQQNLAIIEIDFDYTDAEDHHAKFVSQIKNLSKEVGYKNYTISVSGVHAASELNLAFDASLGLKLNNYKMEATGLYKRGYLPEMGLEMIGFVDIDNKEIKFYRSTPNKMIDIYGITAAHFPVYTIDGVYVDSPEYESAGALVLDFGKKFINADVNFTSDASQNLQVRGSIPDTRSAAFNVWRNYEDVRINDISYFVQMNHSRLITSKFIWRPKMRKEVKDAVKDFMTSRYSAVAKEMDYWVKTFYGETKDTINGIWDESREYTREFMIDLSAVKDIDDDLSAFRNFLNDSFNADDFYIQSFINYTMTVLDELAITDHLQTIPKIFKEMWEVLGESSLAFKNSILWIIDTIKSSYKESVEMFNQLMQGDSLDHLTKFLEIIIEKYDRFVKDLHVTFMNYIESMWDNLVRTISIYWNRILQNIEPQIIRSIHYVESILWGISTEVFDFMYNRTNELIESPYFTKVSNITHDLDVLYQDLQNNDIFTNLRKYSGVMWQFVKEKFLSLVPFGKELKEIVADISNEFKELQKIEAVKEAVERYEEVVAKITWLMNEFQFEKRLNLLVDIAKNKLTRITQNALQTEDVYREAKTKFIFDPDVGKIEWEQKLPMAWHAFNETPQFEEIPEYKLFNDVQAFLFSKKNSSFWNLYYSLKPLTEPQNFLPPFNSHALLIGSRHIITFDNSIVNFEANDFGELTMNSLTLDEGCSYLLAHDFIGNRFSFILKPSTLSEQGHNFLSKTVVLKVGDEVIEIELGNPMGTIRIGDNLTSVLPFSFGELIITRELNVVTVSSRRGFTVRCNLEFDVCSIELSGWFFGKIAGLLGTMNNEKFDDRTNSDNTLAVGNEEFTDSWKLESTCSPFETKPTDLKNETKQKLEKSCELFFKQKTSYFTSCFTIVDPDPFYQICLNLDLPRYKISVEAAEKAACIAGIAYIETCAVRNVPLRVPDTCINCKLPNGTHISEGTFTELKDEMVIPAVDVVFLIESRSCNIDASKKKMLSTLVTSLTTEFKYLSIDHHRFAVVTFGGSNEFEQPRSITSNGHVFTSAQSIPKYFNHLRDGNGTSDVFTAIAVASKLIFKPGAVKIFVLSLCSKCDFNLLKFDFKSVSQLLRENDITLHIMSDNPFNPKKVIGIDSSKAFIKKDQTKLAGDEVLRKTVAPIKTLGQCTSLAFGTEGSIFTTKSINKKNENDFKAISNVFAKRIARDVKPKSCHLCECEGHNSGTAYMTCMSCDNQESGIDYDIDETLETDIDGSYEDEL